MIDYTPHDANTVKVVMVSEKEKESTMPDDTTQDSQTNDDIIVIMENEVIKSRKKPEELHKYKRGFNVIEKDSSGNLSMRYVKTAVIKIDFVRKGGGRADSVGDAVAVITTYYDKDGNVLRSNYGTMYWQDTPPKTSNFTKMVPPPPVR